MNKREAEGTPGQPGAAGSPPAHSSRAPTRPTGAQRTAAVTATAGSMPAASTRDSSRVAGPAGFHSSGPETPSAAEGGRRRRDGPEARRRAGATCAAESARIDRVNAPRAFPVSPLRCRLDQSLDFNLNQILGIIRVFLGINKRTSLQLKRPLDVFHQLNLI